MRKLLLLCVLVSFSMSTVAQRASVATKPQSSPKQQRPKLIVGIVVDQMRYDYLAKFGRHFKSGGFHRLMSQGFNCENTYIDYVPSVTGCGHAGIYTGTVPAIHGISSNNWYIRKKHKEIYCVEDESVQTVGGIGKSGQMSPRNMVSNTITDELRIATCNRSKVIGVALKDRGSILPAGHLANAAYWMDDSMGNFVTSTYYMQQVPRWVETFNQAKHARRYLNKNWNRADHHDYYIFTNDETPYEGKFKTDSNVRFPHNLSAFTKDADIKRTAYGNDITLDFAEAAIAGENLGGGNYTDFLAISLSSTDYVGHQFGIDAVEIEDMYITLNKRLEQFFVYLDKRLGAGNYTVFLTSDHGAAHNPKFLSDQKMPAGFFFPSVVKKKINDSARAVFGHAVVADIGDNMVWITDSVPEDKATLFVYEYMKDLPEMQMVIPFENAANHMMPERIKRMVINGYYKGRSGEILYLLKPAFIEGFNANTTTGTTHGTWNPYDCHIPMLWYGFGIKKGNSFTKYYMHDIASTIAALLHIQTTNGDIGTPMQEVLLK